MFVGAALASLNVNPLDAQRWRGLELRADARLGLEALSRSLSGWRADPAWTRRYHATDPNELSFGGRVEIFMRDGSKLKDEMAVANVVGSNIFNLLLILGVTGLLSPIPADPTIVSSDMWVMMGFTVLLFPLAALLSGLFPDPRRSPLFA